MPVQPRWKTLSLTFPEPSATVSSGSLFSDNAHSESSDTDLDEDYSTAASVMARVRAYLEEGLLRLKESADTRPELDIANIPDGYWQRFEDIETSSFDSSSEELVESETGSSDGSLEEVSEAGSAAVGNGVDDVFAT